MAQRTTNLPKGHWLPVTEKDVAEMVRLAGERRSLNYIAVAVHHNVKTVRNCLNEQGIIVPSQAKTRLWRRGPGSEKHRSPVTQDEVDLMVRLYRDGHGACSIAGKVKRNPSTVREKLEQLGVWGK